MNTFAPARQEVVAVKLTFFITGKSAGIMKDSATSCRPPSVWTWKMPLFSLNPNTLIGSPLPSRSTTQPLIVAWLGERRFSESILPLILSKSACKPAALAAAFKLASSDIDVFSNVIGRGISGPLSVHNVPKKEPAIMAMPAIPFQSQGPRRITPPPCRQTYRIFAISLLKRKFSVNLQPVLP